MWKEGDQERTLTGALFVAAFTLALAAGGACGSGGGAGSGGATGTGGTTSGSGGTSSSTAVTTSSGTGGSPACATSCDDGFSCTIDTCVAGTCRHVVGPNQGATACPAGSYCDAAKGCVPAPACQKDADCVQAWANDPCKTNPVCDHATASCTFQPLDGDGDGYAAVACGGDDCDDSSAYIHPDAPETCNGKDENCNGLIDEDADWSCGKLKTCETAGCTCKPQNLCNGNCVDIQTDSSHCGNCATACAPNEVCTAGTCACPPAAMCGGACIDVDSDPKNCGGCGTTCPSDAACVGGQCLCNDSVLKVCAGQCVPLEDNPMNCGLCGVVCKTSEYCQHFNCVACQSGKTRCGNTCVDLQTSWSNCGTCGHVCPDTCSGGVCTGGTTTGTGTGTGGSGPACMVTGVACTINTDCCSGVCTAGGTCL
jgi:hypothetical protein